MSFVWFQPHVIVFAALIVAALVSGNQAVSVIDASSRSGIDQLRQHRHDALKQFDPERVQFGVEQFVDSHDVE
ncbi:MAG TPA: hypothetical protein VJR89_31450 [Polyangiales bacterium]|nr:hypothetical protein [Polyangiales bacterium]